MASNTTVNIALQAKDWETIIGVIFPCVDPALQNVFFQLQTYYSGQVTKPPSGTIITIASTEDVVVKIATYLYGTNLNYSCDDGNNNPLRRIMTALRALNNTGDNYINTQFVTFDAGVGTTQQTIRKNGRKYIMMLQYDSN